MLLATCSASLRDLNRFSLLHFNENGEVSRHFCTCRFGNTSANSIPTITKELQEYRCALEKGEYRVVGELPDNVEAQSANALKVLLQ